jgi:hypothetical protein
MFAGMTEEHKEKFLRAECGPHRRPRALELRVRHVRRADHVSAPRGRGLPFQRWSDCRAPRSRANSSSHLSAGWSLVKPAALSNDRCAPNPPPRGAMSSAVDAVASPSFRLALMSPGVRARTIALLAVPLLCSLAARGPAERRQVIACGEIRGVRPLADAEYPRGLRVGVVAGRARLHSAGQDA